MQDVEAVGLQPFEAQLDLTSGVISLSCGDLRRHGDLLAALGHGPADPLFVLAVAITMSSVDVSDAQVESPSESLEGFVLLGIHEESAAGAEAEDGDLDACLAERAGRQLGVRPGGEERGRGDADSGLEKLTPRTVHGYYLTVRGWVVR